MELIVTFLESYQGLCILFTGIMMIVLRIVSKEKENKSFPGPGYKYGLGPLITYIHYLYNGIPEASSYYLKKYGDTVHVWVCGEPTIVTNNPTVARHIFKNNGINYTSRLGYDTGLKHIGMFENGIIWNNNTKIWKKLRLFFQNALNAKTLNSAIHASVSAAKNMTCKLNELRQRTQDGRVETLNVLRRITLEITNTLMFGVDIENDEKLVEIIVEYFKAWEYFLIRPWYLYYFDSKFKVHTNAVKDLWEACQEIVRQKKTKMKNVVFDDLENPNFLECMIHAMNENEISEDNIIQCVLEMLLAGTDTSSVSMYYTLVALCDDREVEENIVKEIKEILPVSDFDIDRVNLSNLKNLENALKEGMRIKPVGPVVLRKALKDDVINDVPIKAGTNIIISLLDMHKRNDLFTKPTEFNPNRFKQQQLENPDFFYPFGTGPKGCVGQFLAMIEMKVVVSLLLKDFTFTSAVGQLKDVDTRWDIANQPTDASYMFIQPRSYAKLS